MSLQLLKTINLFGQEGRWKCHIKYIGQYCFSSFLSWGRPGEEAGGRPGGEAGGRPGEEAGARPWAGVPEAGLGTGWRQDDVGC